MVFSYASPSRSRPGGGQRLRGDHWRPPPRRRVRGRGPLTRADPPRCSPSKAIDASRAYVQSIPARSKPRFPRLVPTSAVLALARALPAASRRRDEPCTPEADTGASFPKAFSALSRGARERRTRSRNHGPGAEHGDVRRPTCAARAAPAATRALAALRAGFCLRAASASRRRANVASRGVVSRRAVSSLPNGKPSERTEASGGAPPEALLRQGAAAAAQSRARRRSRTTPRRICAQIIFCLRAASAALRPRPRRRRETRARPGRPVRRHTRRRIRARTLLSVFF